MWLIWALYRAEVDVGGYGYEHSSDEYCARLRSRCGVRALVGLRWAPCRDASKLVNGAVVSRAFVR